jgi:hypothetical protein
MKSFIFAGILVTDAGTFDTLTVLPETADESCRLHPDSAATHACSGMPACRDCATVFARSLGVSVLAANVAYHRAAGASPLEAYALAGGDLLAPEARDSLVQYLQARGLWLPDEIT